MKDSSNWVVTYSELTSVSWVRETMPDYARAINAETLHTAASRILYHLFPGGLGKRLGHLDEDGVYHPLTDCTFSWPGTVRRNFKLQAGKGVECQSYRDGSRRIVEDMATVVETMSTGTDAPQRVLYENVAHVLPQYADERNFQVMSNGLNEQAKGIDLPLPDGPNVSEGSEYERRTCCLNYRLSGQYCAGCPVS